MLYWKYKTTLILISIIIFLLSLYFNGCLLVTEFSKSNSLTPRPTVKPNLTNILKEILSLNWGHGNDEVGCNTIRSDRRQELFAFGISYGPPDFFVDKDEKIYILDIFNNRILKFHNQKICNIFYHEQFGSMNYPIFYVDNKGNLYVIEIPFQNDKNYKVLKIDNDNICLVEQFPKNFRNYEIKTDDNENRKELWFKFKDEKMEILFPLKATCNSDFEFLGVDEEYNFYFYQVLMTNYSLSEIDKIEGVIIHEGPEITANRGLILYKYNAKGKLSKEIKIDDPIPYKIKINARGSIYLTPRLETKALLQISLDKYRIYKFTM